MLSLFLSYAHQNADPVRRCSTDLRRTGIEPWMDDELKLAGIWNDEINERIAARNFFMPLLSKATQEGDENGFFRKDWQLAYEAKRKFFPVRLEECQLPASVPKNLAALIESHQRVDLFPSYEESLRLILRFLHQEKRTGVFEETFSCLGADNDKWRLGGWQLDDADTTGEQSGSIHSAVRLASTELLPQTVSQTATIDIDLPGRPLMLRYRRRLRLSAPVGGAAEFRVAIDGEVIDLASQSDPSDDEWTTRSVPVPERGARRARLEITVTASSTLNYCHPLKRGWTTCALVERIDTRPNG